MMKSASFAALAFGLLAATPARAEVVYFEDFDEELVTFSYSPAGVTANDNFGATETAAAGAWNAQGWDGNYAVNRSTGNPAALTFITLSGLAANSAVTIGSGILGFLESWDSTNGSCCTPDFLDFYINGILVSSMTANNALGTNEFYDGATELHDGVQVNANAYYSDTLVDLSTAQFANSFADGSGTWTFGIQASGVGWQGGADEGWGIDNIEILGTVAGAGVVPEPSAWALMILGLGVTGAALRRQRAQRAAPTYA